MSKVSVIIASYNHARYICECLDSVLSQTYPDLEVVVVDDGSTDGSHAILLDYSRSHSDRVQYCWHAGHTNQGISATWNLALEHTRGEFIAWLGSDDIWLSDKLERQVAYLIEHPHVGMVYSQAQVIDEVGIPQPKVVGGDRLPAHFFEDIFILNFVPALTAIARRTCLEEIGNFDVNLVYSDWELWIRLAAKFPVGFIAESLALYRVHGNNISAPANAAIILGRDLAVIETACAKIPQIDAELKRHALEQAHYRCASRYYDSGQLLEAGEQLATAVSLGLEPHNAMDTTILAYAHQHPVAEGLIYLTAAFANLPAKANTLRSLKAWAIARFYMARVFEAQNTNERSLIRYCLPRAVIHDPAWLSNRGVLSIALQAFFGRRKSLRP